MKSHWVVLQHVEWEGPGIIALEARKRSIEVDIRRLDREDDIPDADQIDGLVVMGGPLGAYEEEWYPFLVKECALLTAVVQRGTPVLGVCLGAQLLARSLGGKVFPGHGAEIGFGSVELLEEGQRDELFTGLGHTLPVFHWHGDSFSLPDGAVLLASNENYTHQAFRIGSRAYGLQFHLEPDAETWSAWRDHLPRGLIDNSTEMQREVEETGRTIISRFFDQVSDTEQVDSR